MFLQDENKDLSNKNVLDLQNYIRSNIPVTEFMDFSVEDLQPYSIKLSAPIKPNDNHYGTAFGGSLATLGILAGWSILHFRALEEELKCVLVIQEGSMKYIRPAHTDFEATCNTLNEKLWNEFKSGLLAKGKARISMFTNLYSQGELIATHK
jgi:thioesterase domain-containing protein